MLYSYNSAHQACIEETHAPIAQMCQKHQEKHQEKMHQNKTFLQKKEEKLQ